jgi:hypothetical protein
MEGCSYSRTPEEEFEMAIIRNSQKVEVTNQKYQTKATKTVNT